MTTGVLAPGVCGFPAGRRLGCVVVGFLCAGARSARGFWVDGSEAPRVLGSNRFAGHGGRGLGMRRCWGVGALVRLWGQGVGMRGVEMPGRRWVRGYGASGGLACRTGETRWFWCPGAGGLMSRGDCMSETRPGREARGCRGPGCMGGWHHSAVACSCPGVWRDGVGGAAGRGTSDAVGPGGCRCPVLSCLGAVSVPCSHVWVLSGLGFIIPGCGGMGAAVVDLLFGWAC